MTSGRQKGFTLIEILVVMTIVAVMASVAVISVRGRDAQSVIDESVRQLAYSLRVAEEETLFRRRQLGLLLAQNGYLFLTEDEEGWYPVDDRFFKPGGFPENLRVSLYVDGVPKALDSKIDDVEEKLEPQVTFVPDAEPVPFEILFNMPELEERKLQRTPSGRVVTNLGDG